VLIGVWLAIVGSLFAVAPGPTSLVADRIRRLRDPQPPSPAQKRYARISGLALVCIGALVMVAVR
jgi:hypothetical protein